MYDLKFIRDNYKDLLDKLQKKGFTENLSGLLDFDTEWRQLLEQADAMKQKRNTVSRQIADLKRQKQDTSALVMEMQEVSSAIKGLDESIGEVYSKITDIVFSLPNIPHASVPVGKNANENIEIRSWGDKPVFDFPVKDHFTIGKDLNLFDFNRGSKIAGSGFPLFTGKGAQLERALINFMLDYHIEKHGYNEVYTPFLANREAVGGTGQLPKLEDDMYHIEHDDLFLIPTAEVPVTNIYKDEILHFSQLPINHVAFSPCFRREAGSYGKDTKGLQRVHQFNKVEMVKFVMPENSYNELETLVDNAEDIVRELGLHYRVIELCTADLSFAAAKCYDIEVWSPAEEKYLEVSSCSNFEAFQARRIGIRFRRKSGEKVGYVHTLNGSGVATPRLMIAMLETYQTDEGSVVIPEALRSYTGFEILKPSDL